MTVRFQFQFQDVTDPIALGWTENWYSSLGNSDLLSRALLAANVIPFRLGILAYDYRLSGLRAVTIGNRTDTVFQGFTIGQGQGTVVGAPNTSWGEQPWDAMLVRCSGSATPNPGLRQFALRGMPTNVWKDTITIVNANWMSAFQRFKAALLTCSVVLRQLTYPQTIVLAAPPTVVNGRALQFAVPAPTVAWIMRGQQIRVRGVQGCDAANHNWRISDVQISGATANVITYQGRRALQGTPAGIVAVDQIFPIYTSPIGDMVPIRAMKRNIGRPPALLRGRASVRKG